MVYTPMPDSKPLTLVVRLWHRPEGVRAEVKELRTGETRLFKNVEDLMAYLEQPQSPKGLGKTAS
ncbi:MAG: hypothetical protein KC422_24610 [Trueperaceae bacterium]|nr:hypothetical protein [Trueperaceae bacterium]